MDGKVNYTLVGLFVLLLGGALIGIATWLGSTSSDVEYDTYVVYLSESVAGLNAGAPVKYRGVDVGKVRRISLDKKNPERVKLLLDIEDDTPVKTDTVAMLSRQGLTGLAYVDLAGGTKSAPLLKPKENQPFPEIIAGPSLLLRLDNAVTTGQTEILDLTREVKQVAKNLNALFTGPNRQAIDTTLKNIELTTASLNKQTGLIEKNLQEMAVVLKNVGQVTKTLPAVTDQAKAGLGAIETTAKTMTETVHHLDTQLNTILSETQTDLKHISHNTLSQVTPLLTEVRQLSTSLRRLAQDLQRNPNLLVFGRPERKPGPGETAE